MEKNGTHRGQDAKVVRLGGLGIRLPRRQVFGVYFSFLLFLWMMLIVFFDAATAPFLMNGFMVLLIALLWEAVDWEKDVMAFIERRMESEKMNRAPSQATYFNPWRFIGATVLLLRVFEPMWVGFRERLHPGVVLTQAEGLWLGLLLASLALIAEMRLARRAALKDYVHGTK